MESYEEETSIPAVVENCFDQTKKIVKSRCSGGPTNLIGSLFLRGVSEEGDGHGAPEMCIGSEVSPLTRGHGDS
jgi:hypothetical protein